jgi:hypothetical protein
MEPARLNHQRYCARHGYTYACLEENIAQRSDPTWSKIPHVLLLGREKLLAVGWWMSQSHAPSSRRLLGLGWYLPQAASLLRNLLQQGADFVFWMDADSLFLWLHFCSPMFCPQKKTSWDVLLSAATWTS